MAGKVLRWVFLGIGIAILILVLTEIDLVWLFTQLKYFGWLSFSIVLGIYLLAFWLDAVSWTLAIEDIPISWIWTWRTFAARIAGEAYNALIPAAGMGGEPTKAYILKRRFGIDLKASGASLVIAKTVNMIALIAFLIGGFLLIQSMNTFPETLRTMAGLGLSLFVVGTTALLLLQRFRLTSRLALYLAKRSERLWVHRTLANLEEVDRIFVKFYQDRSNRFGCALALAFANWLLGMIEIYVVMLFLGHPIDWSMAWVIEAATQMVRTAAFFIPAAIGVQEGTFLIICGLLTGSPDIGVAAALIRRAREIIWIIIGLIFATVLNKNP